MTVRGVITRFLSVFAALAVVLVTTLGMAPAANAAPKFTSVTVTGDDMEKLAIDAGKRPELFNLLLSEVSWLANATPQTSAPKKDKLGPKFVLTVMAKDKAQQVYELYPSATGGPRAFRPSKQPSGKKKEGWFYGRLTMSESLRVSGVPLEAKQDVISGGIGGGTVGETVAQPQRDPMEAVNGYVKDFQQLFLINGAVLVVVLFGLAGVAFLIRRKV